MATLAENGEPQMKGPQMKRLLLATVFGVSLIGPAAAGIQLGAYANPDGQASFQDFMTFNSNVVVNGGPQLSIDNSYYKFDWSDNNNAIPRAEADIQNGFIPMMSVGASDPDLPPNGCVSLFGVSQGFYDSTLETEANSLGQATA